jgi:glutamate formiminotransferase/formiminotetrahydrofolate cyclodeaminase
LFLVDEDTRSFNKIIDAIRLPKASDEEKAARAKAITKATKYAIEVPFQVMQTAFESFGLLEEMARNGNPNSVSDAGVGALCAKAAVEGAFLNVIINCKDLKDKFYVDEITEKADKLLENATKKEREIMNLVLDKIK